MHAGPREMTRREGKLQPYGGGQGHGPGCPIQDGRELHQTWTWSSEGLAGPRENLSNRNTREVHKDWDNNANLGM